MLEKSKREPVDKFNDRHKADSEAKSTNATDVGDEVKPSHFLWSFELLNVHYQWKVGAKGKLKILMLGKKTRNWKN